MIFDLSIVNNLWTFTTDSSGRIPYSKFALFKLIEYSSLNKLLVITQTITSLKFRLYSSFDIINAGLLFEELRSE